MRRQKKDEVKRSIIIGGFSLFVMLLQGCYVFQKDALDKHLTRYINKHPKDIEDLATYVVSITYSTSKTKVTYSDIENRRLKKTLRHVGWALVQYSRGKYEYADTSLRNYYEVPDSNVTFENLSLFTGKTEIIYYFGEVNKSFISNKNNNKRDYYFIKVTDRIYYRRSLFPMM